MLKQSMTSMLNYLYEMHNYRINPFQSIVAMFFLAFVPHILKSVTAKRKLIKAGKKVTISNSRAEAMEAIDSTPEGIRIAAYAGCHINSLEAFSYFSVAILSAVVTKVPNQIIEKAAATFLAIRIVYTTVYLGPLNGILRSLVWVVGVWICMDLLLRASEHYSSH